MKDFHSYSKPNRNTEPVVLPHREDEDTFSINCLFRAIRIEESACLLSRTHYCFPSTLRISIEEAMQHANCLNRRVSQSKVHVVKDIDGDRGYFLQMDSILRGDRTPAALSTFLDNIEKDMEVILQYFQQETCTNQMPSLAAVARKCNAASLSAHVRLVA